MDTLLTGIRFSMTKCILFPMTFSLTYILVYIISQWVFMNTQLNDRPTANHPYHTPFHLSSGYHGNATERTQPHEHEMGDKIDQHGNIGSENNPNPQWINHTNYKNLMHSPRPTFLPHYRSPCMEIGSSIMCLPSVYLAGMPKCGSTDLFKKITRHPNVILTRKEPHWWTRKRFMDEGIEDNVGHYMEYYKQASEHISKICDHEGNTCHNADLIVDGSPSTFWDNFQWKEFPGNKNEEEPVMLNAHHIKHLTPDVKIIVIFRNPIDRLYSGYLYFKTKMKTSPDDFHRKVKKSIKSFSKCLETNTPRQCAYNRTLNKNLQVRLNVGLYSIYADDWLNVFPRDQFHFVSLEEYSKDKEAALKEIFKFLLLAPPPASYFQIIEKLHISNSRSPVNRSKGEMRNDTRGLLRDFYMPFNRHLVETLKDNRFDYIS